MSAHITFIKHCTRCSSHCNKASQMKRNHQNLERSKLFFFSDDMTIHVRNTKDFIKRATGTNKRV